MWWLPETRYNLKPKASISNDNSSKLIFRALVITFCKSFFLFITSTLVQPAILCHLIEFLFPNSLNVHYLAKITEASAFGAIEKNALCRYFSDTGKFYECIFISFIDWCVCITFYIVVNADFFIAGGQFQILQIPLFIGLPEFWKIVNNKRNFEIQVLGFKICRRNISHCLNRCKLPIWKRFC